MTWDGERDLLGLDLDGVLEGYECGFVVEPGNALLDPGVRDKLDRAHPSQMDALFDANLLHESWSSPLDDHANRVYGAKP